MSAVVGPLVGLVLILAVLPLIVSAARPMPPREMAAQLAYREGRQCFTACYSLGGGAPERCVFPEDHYGDCDTEVRRPTPRKLAQSTCVDPWAEVAS